jgi:tetratricopeptide (TPR) repeat protein
MSRAECPTDGEVLAFRHGELPGPDRRAIAEHLALCPRCQQAARAADPLADPGVTVLRPDSSDAEPPALDTLHPRRLGPAERIGPYEILGELGRGGMGVVYRARHVELNRVVALKMLLRSPSADPAGQIRFRTEAEAVARMQHPNIVQLFEVGQHEGQPYLTLELVEGGSLADHADGKAQPPAQAARWLELLARAVQYAHERGVLHRDLKPANVLLTAEGTPKVSDFGLARPVERVTGPTSTGAILGTPAYMAPEQVDASMAVGPRADVWGLGAILYELLTGRPPFVGETPWEVLLRVKVQDPVPPRLLWPGVPRDLETVCLKCLEKQPQGRYGSAGELADEMRRFLDGRPIQARPINAWGRLVRWARRRPVVAALSAGLLAVTLLGIGLVTWQWQEAEAAAQEARAARGRAEATARSEANARHAATASETRALDFEKKARAAVVRWYVYATQDPRMKAIGLEDLRKELLLEARAFLQDFTRGRGDDPGAAGDRALAHFQLASVLVELKEFEPARREFATALALYRKLAGRRLDLHSVRSDVANCLHNLAALDVEAGRLKEAEATYDECLALRRSLAEAYPAVAGYRADLAGTVAAVGLMHLAAKRHAAAEQCLKKALALRRQLADELPKRSQPRRDVADSLNALAGYYNAQGRFADAEVLFRQTVKVEQALADAEPHVPQWRFELAVAHLNLGQILLAAGQLAEAKDSLLQSIKLGQQLLDGHPAVPLYRQRLAAAYHYLGRVHAAAGRAREAEQAVLRAAELRQPLLEKRRAEATVRHEQAFSWYQLAVWWLPARRHADAESALLKAISLWKELLREQPGVAERARVLGNTLSRLGQLKMHTARPLEAVAHASEAIHWLNDAVNQAPKHAQARLFLRNAHWLRAEARTRLGLHAEAITDWDRTIALDTGTLRRTFRQLRAASLASSGKHAEATAEVERLVEAGELSASVLYGLACVVSVAAKAAPPGEVRERYAARALELLQRAVDGGFADVRRIETSPELAAVRQCEGFRKVLAALQKKSP